MCTQYHIHPRPQSVNQTFAAGLVVIVELDVVQRDLAADDFGLQIPDVACVHHVKFIFDPFKSFESFSALSGKSVRCVATLK